MTDRPAVQPVTFRPIGIIRSPFVDTAGMPIQATAAVGVKGRIELDPDLVEGLADLDGFSHLTLLYHLHLITSARLTVTPFLDDEARGIFATRSPARPNAIGISTVRLVAINGSAIDIEDVDVVDGTPLLDIKPYVPAFDDREGVRVGWFAERLGRLSETLADDRFGAEGSRPGGKDQVITDGS
jgi:tRNA-Thr(GGU) m(6)t(6)A37 methyltransferase TsaA